MANDQFISGELEGVFPPMNPALRMSSVIHCDVLIVGAGGAGLRCAAAILEKRPGTRIVAVTKVASPQKSHTQTAQGGIAAVDPREPMDHPIYHMFDTWKGSDCTADQNVVKKIVESGWEQVVWMEKRGMHFSRREDGRLSKRTFGGHTVEFGKASAFRCLFEADRTGKGIMDTVWGEGIKGNATFVNQSVVTELLFTNHRCVGAVVFRQKEGEFITVVAEATVLSTGGNGQVFKVTTNCRQNTGDGNAVVLAAGLPVMDPEAIQFHPTGIVGPGILASETLRSVGGILRNRELVPFMERYAPKMRELAPRDLVARAIETEIREGRGVLNPDHEIEHVWIDLTHLPDHVHDVEIPEVTGFFKRFVNLDPKKDLCPVRPSNHYQMGGIPTTEHGEVQKKPGEIVPGLFAVGECAAGSFHGFNRLGTNSLLELITMGAFTGQRVVDCLGSAPPRAPKDAGEKTFSSFSRFLEAGGRGSVGRIRGEMRRLMTEKVGVFRTERGLNEAIDGLKELEDRAGRSALSGTSLRMNQDLMQRWELENLLINAMVIAKGALHRKESRGGHFRDDYPIRDDSFHYHTLIYSTGFEECILGKRPVNMSIYEEQCENYEKFGVIERNY